MCVRERKRVLQLRVRVRVSHYYLCFYFTLIIKTQNMAPTNRSKSRKAEVAKSHKFSKTIDTDLKFSKTIDTELKNMKKPVIVSPPRISIKSNDNTTE